MGSSKSSRIHPPYKTKYRVGVCKHDAIGYRFGGLSPATSRAVFFVLVACFHAGCLAVARI